VELSGTFAAMRWGLRSAWACRRLLLVLLAANLILALAVLFPLYASMDASLSHHPEAGRIGRQLDIRWWTDWTYARAGLIERSLDLLGVASFLTVLTATFFAGGLLEALRYGPHPSRVFEPLPDPWYRGATPEWRAASPGPSSLQGFFRASARHFPRFAVLLLLSLPCYRAVEVILNRLAVVGLDATLEKVEDGRLGLALTVARAAIFVVAFQAVTVLFEYARVHEVLKPGATLRAVLSTPFRLLWARPGTLLGIEIAAFLLQLAAMIAFIPLDHFLGRWPPLAATAGFIAMQLFLFVRVWLRAGAQAAQIRLAQSHLKTA
jgi:hypothetical protein